MNLWFQKLMRQFFFNIDKIVYSFISILYNFLTDIARTSVLSQADIMSMADRIYKLLAVFMVFKVTFSLIMYVVNPDDFSDKSKGIGKLGTNILFSLLILILTPFIFNYAYQLQTIILEDNSLANLVFGRDEGNIDAFNTAGDKMAYMTMAPFFSPDTSIAELTECAQLTVGQKSDTTLIFNDACSGLDENYNKIDGDADSLASLVDDKAFPMQTLKNYVAGVELGNLGLMFRQDMALAITGENEFVIDYKYLFSTVIGIVIVLLLISFCMDVAVRSIKLAFLQLIAPIPILSYVDPKSGKDGLFKKWYQMCFKTFISLFVRLLAIYFAIHIISKVDKMVDIVNGSYVSNMFIKIFIIIGALMFAQQLPKILDGLGIKLDKGGFTLNPLNKIKKEMKGGKQILGAAGAAGAIGASTLAATAGALGNVKSRWSYAQGARAKAGLIFGGLTSGLSTGFRAGRKGIVSAMKGEGISKSFTNSYKQAMSGEKTRMDRIADGVGAFELGATKVESALGMKTRAEKVEEASKGYKAANEKYKAAKDNIVAVDAVAKSLNEQLKIVESSSIDRNAFYSRDTAGNIMPGSFNAAAYNAAVSDLAARKKNLNDAIDNRVKKIMNGDDSVYMDLSGSVSATANGGYSVAGTLSNINSTSTKYAQQMKKDIESATKRANDIADSVDSSFESVNIDDSNPKSTAKGAQTASSAFPATKKSQHASDVGKYAKDKNR